MVVLDTNVVIDHLRQPLEKSTLFRHLQKHHKDTICLSIISVQELFEGKSTRTPEKQKDLLATVGPLKILAYTYEVARLAGEIARDLARPIDFADAAIAATAIINGATLFTLDKRDFIGIPDLNLEFSA